MLHSSFVSLAALVSVALSGCAVPAGVYGFGPLKVVSHGLNDRSIAEGLDRYQQQIEDPNGYLRYLGEREFVIEGALFDAYACTVDTFVAMGWFTHTGGYIGVSHLGTDKKKAAFRKRLSESGVSPDAVSFYESLFASWDIIIFRESILVEEFFLEALLHERFHKAMEYLRNDEYRYHAMRQAAKELMERRVPLPEPMEFTIDGKTAVLTDKQFVEERWYPEKTSFGDCVVAASMNWEEFYAFLAQGEFDASVEEALARDYPEAYAMFTRLRDECSLKD